jgi:hypothetical protein
MKGCHFQKRKIGFKIARENNCFKTKFEALKFVSTFCVIHVLKQVAWNKSSLLLSTDIKKHKDAATIYNDN